MTETTGKPGQADDDGLLEGAAMKTMHPGLKLALELGPLVIFFMANQRLGIIQATGVFMVAALVSLAVCYALTRRLPVMPMVSAVVLAVFGGLTLWYNDPVFIKLKPTVVNTLFGVVLLGSLAFGKPLLPVLLESMLPLDAEGWRKLTLRWGLFFFLLAIINEVVWRNFSESFWISFKAWGIMPLTILFALAQTPLILRHEIKQDPAGQDG